MNKRHELGAWLKQKRLEKGLTLQGLGDRLGYRSFGSINSFERAATPIPLEKIHPYAEALGVPLEEFLRRIQEAEPELYARYMALRKDIAHYLVYGPRAGLAAHHLPFPGERAGSDNNSYGKQLRSAPTVYIMSTSPGDPSWSPPVQESIKFPDNTSANQLVLEGIHDLMSRNAGVYH